MSLKLIACMVATIPHWANGEKSVVRKVLIEANGKEQPVGSDKQREPKAVVRRITSTVEAGGDIGSHNKPAVKSAKDYHNEGEPGAELAQSTLEKTESLAGVSVALHSLEERVEKIEKEGNHNEADYKKTLAPARREEDLPSIAVHNISGQAETRQQCDFNAFHSLKTTTTPVDESDAQFSWVPCFPDQLHESHYLLDFLPSRSPERPYLVWGLDWNEGSHCKPVREMLKRSDVLFASPDLRNHCLGDDESEPLPGITTAPPKYYRGPSYDPTVPPKYFLTFQGKLTGMGPKISNAREDLRETYKGLNRKDIVVNVWDRGHHYTEDDAKNYFTLMDTAFAIVPHGDGRWNFRFSEVVGACAIPVIIADGLMLPYSQLINWERASIQLTEKVLKDARGNDTHAVLETDFSGRRNAQLMAWLANPDHLLKQLPTDINTIQAMRSEVCKINEAYFKTPKARATALLKAAAAQVDPMKTFSPRP